MIGLGGNLITVEQSVALEKMNINVSTVFVQTAFRALYLMKKMIEPQKEEDNQGKKSFALEDGGSV